MSIKFKGVIHKRDKSQETVTKAMNFEEKKFNAQTAKILQFSRQKLKPAHISFNDTMQ